MSEDLDLLIITAPSLQLKGPPMGPALLKGYLSKKDFSVKCVDYNIETFHLLEKDKRFFMAETHQLWCDESQFEDFYQSRLEKHFKIWVEEIIKIAPRWVGISIHWQGMWRASEKICELIRKANPLQKIVIGGPYAKSIYQRFVERGIIDTFILGEGERRLEELLAGDGYLESAKFAIDVDLDTLPPSDYSDYDRNRYPVNHYQPDCNKMGLKHLYVQTSRGCVLNCSFCNIIGNTGRYKVKEGVQVANEIVSYYESYGVNEFTLADNAVNGSSENLLKMATRLVEYQTDHSLNGIFRWYSHFILNKNFSSNDHELIVKIGQSGCRLLKVGFESGSYKLRRHIGKSYNNEDVFSFLRACIDGKVKVRALFFVGYYLESQSDFEQTLQLIRDIKEFGLQGAVNEICTGHTAMLLPNTRLWKNCPSELVLDRRFPGGTMERHWKYRENDLYLRIERHREFTKLSKSLGFVVDDPLEFDADYLLSL